MLEAVFQPLSSRTTRSAPMPASLTQACQRRPTKPPMSFWPADRCFDRRHVSRFVRPVVCHDWQPVREAVSRQAERIPRARKHSVQYSHGYSRPERLNQRKSGQRLISQTWPEVMFCTAGVIDNFVGVTSCPVSTRQMRPRWSEHPRKTALKPWWRIQTPPSAALLLMTTGPAPYYDKGSVLLMLFAILFGSSVGGQPCP